MTPEELARLHARAFQMSRPWTAAEFAELLASAGVILESGDRGFLLGRLAGDEAEILTLAVDPEVQRQGRARALLAAFEDRVRGGAATVFLEVAADNHAACALYRGAGYTETGRRPGYYARANGAAADALVLAKRLTQN